MAKAFLMHCSHIQRASSRPLKGHRRRGVFEPTAKTHTLLQLLVPGVIGLQAVGLITV